MARRRGAPTPADRPELVATRYELLEKVGAGGVANVYKALDTRLNRTVALKILRDEYASDAEFVERFQREAHIAAGLNHPNVVSVDDYGRHGNTAFLAMHFVDGETLKARMRRVGRMPPDEAVGIARQVLGGLAAAHAQGLVHRDVKPHNVLLGWDGVAKLTDFGIALAAAAVGLTQTGTTVGTAAYAAPEQVTGKTVGPPADVYGVGLLLYEMLTGRPPFGGGSVMELAWAHVNEQPTPPSELVDGVPAELDALVMRALAKDPTARFADAATMLGALEGRELLTPPPVTRPTEQRGEELVEGDATVRLAGASAGDAGEGNGAGDGTVGVGAARGVPLIPAALLGAASGTSARLRQWVGQRPSRAVAVPALVGALALGGLFGVPRVMGGVPTPDPFGAPEPSAAVLAQQATPAAEANGEPSAPTPTVADRQLSAPLWMAPLDGPLPPQPGSEATSTPASQPPAAVSAASVQSAPAPAAPDAQAPSPNAPQPPPADAGAAPNPAPPPTATPAPPTPTSAPAPPQQAAPPPQPAPSGPPPSPPQPTATPQPAATAPPKTSTTPAATPSTPAPAGSPTPATSPAATPPPASTPAATAAPPAPTPVPTNPSRPPAGSSPVPTSAPQPTAAQPTPSSGG
jgi:hypothetical protein